MKFGRLRAAAIGGALGILVSGSAANALTFNFSFTDLTGTVTGEIGGLVDNTNNQAATSVTILSAPFGLVVPVSAPIGDATVNNFFVDGGVILSGGFLDTFAAFNSFGPDTVTLRLVIGQPTSVDFGSLTQSFNFCGECLTTGPLTIQFHSAPRRTPALRHRLRRVGSARLAQEAEGCSGRLIDKNIRLDFGDRRKAVFLSSMSANDPKRTSTPTDLTLTLFVAGFVQ